MGSFGPDPEQLFKTGKGPDPTRQKKGPRLSATRLRGVGCSTQLQYAVVPVFEKLVRQACPNAFHSAPVLRH